MCVIQAYAPVTFLATMWVSSARTDRKTQSIGTHCCSNQGHLMKWDHLSCVFSCGNLVIWAQHWCFLSWTNWLCEIHDSPSPSSPTLYLPNPSSLRPPPLPFPSLPHLSVSGQNVAHVAQSSDVLPHNYHTSRLEQTWFDSLTPTWLQAQATWGHPCQAKKGLLDMVC